MNILDKIKSFRKKTFYGFQYGYNKSVRPNWADKKYLSAYESSLLIHTVVKKRAEKVGQINFKLYNAKGDEVENNPYLDLLYKPNKLQTKNEFFEMYQTYKDLTGATYIYVIKTGNKPVELQLLRPDWVEVHYSSDGEVTHYTYKPNSQVSKRLEADEVIASYFPSPLKALSGVSPLKPAATSIDIEEQLTAYQYSVLKNGGKIEGIMNFKAEDITEEQRERIRREFKRHYGGAENSGVPLLLEGGAEYQNLGLSPTELSYIESKKMVRDDILMIFGVPKVIVAQTDDVNYSNAKEGKRVFLSETIKPLLDNLVQKLNEFYIPENLTLVYEDPTPEDIELKLKQLETADRINAMTINEKREMMGLDEIKDGDVILTPFNLVPLGTDNKNSKDETKSIKKKSQNHPLRDEGIRKKYWQAYEKRFEGSEKKMNKAVQEFLKGQKERVVDGMDNQVKGLVDEVFNLSLEIKLAKDLLLPLIQEIAVEAGQETIDFLGLDTRVTLTGRLASTLEKRADLFTKSINETTFEQLKRTFEQNVGEPRDKLINQVQDLYGNISKGRAANIVRTETQVANQTGQFDAYKQANVETKIWVHSAGVQGGIRDNHLAIDGEEVPMDARFSNGLLYPGDPNASADEVINCLCSI